MKPEDKKHCLDSRLKKKTKPYKHSVLAFLAVCSWPEGRRFLGGGGLCVECQLALGFTVGKRQSNFFLFLPFANLIRLFWAARASLLTDECLLMHFCKCYYGCSFQCFLGRFIPVSSIDVKAHCNLISFKGWRSPCQALPPSYCQLYHLEQVSYLLQAASPSAGSQEHFTCPIPNDTGGLSRSLPSLYFLGQQIQSSKGQG